MPLLCQWYRLFVSLLIWISSDSECLCLTLGISCAWIVVPPPPVSLRRVDCLVSGFLMSAERFHGVQPGCHVSQDARETHVVLWIQLGRCGEVGVCLKTELDVRVFVRAKGEWSRDDSWRLACDGLEEDQDVVAIVCDGGQHLGGGLLRLTWFCRLLVLCLDGDYTVFVVFIVCFAGVFPYLCPLRDGASKYRQVSSKIQEFHTHSRANFLSTTFCIKAKRVSPRGGLLGGRSRIQVHFLR